MAAFVVTSNIPHFPKGGYLFRTQFLMTYWEMLIGLLERFQQHKLKINVQQAMPTLAFAGGFLY